MKYLLKNLIIDSDMNVLVSNRKLFLPKSKKNHIPVPNVVLRSALFGVIRKGTRKFEKNVFKSTTNNYCINYTGEQLEQSDLDVWLESLRRYQVNPLGCIVRFSYYEFLKSIGRNTGTSDYEWLKSVFKRLQINNVILLEGKYNFSGNLIFQQYRDDKTGKNCLIINPKILIFFGNYFWTGIDMNVRLKIKGKPLTQWLHGFYSTHMKPFPIKVETIKRLCGSERKDLRKFRYDLKKSLTELSLVTDWFCKIDKEEDKVIIIKNKKIIIP